MRYLQNILLRFSQGSLARNEHKKAELPSIDGTDDARLENSLYLSIPSFPIRTNQLAVSTRMSQVNIKCWNTVGFGISPNQPKKVCGLYHRSGLSPASKIVAFNYLLAAHLLPVQHYHVNTQIAKCQPFRIKT